MGNSIEEDIKILEEFKTNGYNILLMKYGDRIKTNFKLAVEHILSDYKRVLKEVKRYKNMYEAEKSIHMVRNEQLARKQQLVIKCNELENENKELKKDISNMYDEEVIISIISDNFNLSRNEVLKLLGGE
jgi:hypothetical protein